MKHIYITRKFYLSILFLLSVFAGFSQPVGANMNNPINAGFFPGTPFSDTRNNAPANGFGNDIGNASDDIYYRVTITSPGELIASTCTSTFDTYLLLLESSGGILATNDDNGYCAGTLQAGIKMYLQPGTYYVVVEGWSTNYGNINTSISFSPEGATMENAIDAGILNPGMPFTDTKNNSPSNGYLNNMGQSSDDIYYKFTLNSLSEVSLSHCGSGFDTYIHLLDVNGYTITANDDNGPVCPGVLQASIKLQLNPGTYYVVSEGYSSNAGNITTTLSIPGTDPPYPGYTAVIDSLFQHLDKNRIPTGVLYDRAYPLAGIHEFNAIVPDTSANRHFIQAYTEMYQATYNQSAWLPVNEVENIALGKYLNTVPEIPVALAYYQFNVIDTNAIENGQIVQIDSMYYDASPTSNPYITLHTFIASPLIDSINAVNNTVLFNFSPELSFNKTSTAITSLTVDFGNGGAAQAIAINTENSVAINYSSSGYKILKFTLTASDGSTKITYAAVNVKINYAGSSAPLNTCNQTNAYNITSDLSFQGYDENAPSTGKGNVKIFYATNGACDQVLRKPIIILDGFDPGDERSADKLYLEYLNNPNKGGTFGDNMRAQGYDLVILNFPKYQIGTYIHPILPNRPIPIFRDGGADYIERNAMVLIKLIKLINSQKQGNEKLVVIGPSMGGLISRYALKYMEQQNDPHQTRLWISFDSPHRGANIAIGDQYFLDFYSSIADASKKNRDVKISSTAAKQMLVHHYLANSISPAGAPGFRDRFVNVLNNLGFPEGDAGQPFRKVALVDGNLGGLLVNTPSQKGFTFDVRHIKTRHFVFKVRIKTITIASAKMYFTPAYGGTGTVFEGNKPLWKYTRKEASTPSYTIGYDNAPGGTFPTQQILKEQGDGIIGTESAHTIAGKVLNAITGGVFNVESKFYSVIPTHSFISTKSALAFSGSNMNLAENISDRNLVCTGETPFDSYYGDFTKNRDHVELWTGAIDWITNEINGIPQQPPVQSNFIISGPPNFCTSETYTINNLPTGTTVSWSATGDISISSGSTGNSVIVTGSTGNGILSALITTSSCSITISKSISTGSIPIIPNIISSGYLTDSSNPEAVYFDLCSNDPYSSNIHIDLPGVFNLQADPISGPTYPQVYGTSVYWEYPSYGYSEIIMRLEYDTDCSHITQYVYFNNTCFYNYVYRIYPNPADNEITVSYDGIETETTGAQSKKAPKKEFEVELLNNKGEKVRIGKSNGNGSLILNTQAIPEGNYYLHILDGNKIIKKQVIIGHKK